MRVMIRNWLIATAIILVMGVGVARSNIAPQCPPDPKGVCLHVAASDGFIKMADGKDLYIFGFSSAAGINDDSVMDNNAVGAELPAPTIAVKEGDHLYLSLTNVGMMMRPDLFDPHTIHFHGFPQAASVFDGVPEASFGVKMGSTFTYYYETVDPGTYMWHCHQEAAEHIQMGMIGQLYVLPAQDDLPDGTNLNGFIHHTGYKYAYNDGDGSTYYDIEVPVLLDSMDPYFHDQELDIQPVPLNRMSDKYALFNGRGYPDTINPNGIANINGRISQKINTIINAKKGQKVLIRFSSLDVTRHFTVTVQGIPMKVIATSGRQLKGPTGLLMYYTTNSVNVGGGEAIDVILDTTDIAPGTYAMYTTNLNYLSNDQEDYGGMMTEINVTP